METITFSYSSQKSDKWDKEEHSEFEMTAIKCKRCYVILFEYNFKSKEARLKVYTGATVNQTILPVLEGWTQTQLHIGSSLIASCGSQRGKKFLSSNFFLDDCMKLPHARFSNLSMWGWGLSPFWPAGLSSWSQQIAVLMNASSPEIYETKTKPYWSHGTANYLTRSNQWWCMTFV